MKPVILLLSLIFSTLLLTAQPYYLSVSDGPFVNLTDTISLNQGQVWDDPTFTIPIGFDFSYFGESYDTMYLDEGVGGLLLFTDADTGIIPLLMAYGADIIDRGYSAGISESPISYKTEGNPGSRILKLEWRNVGYYGDIIDNGKSVDFTNIQLWLYEGSNDIEIRFGPTLVSQPILAYEDEPGPTIILVPEYDIDNDSLLSDALWLDGPVDSPMIVFSTAVDSFYTLNGTIPDARIYRFSTSPPSATTTLLNHKELLMSPNPTAGSLRLTFLGEEPAEAHIRIFDPHGRLVMNQAFSPTIPVSHLAPGYYQVQVETPAGMYVKKLLVQR